MLRRLRVPALPLVASAVLAAAALGAGVPAGASPEQVRVLDRTFVCTPDFVGGIWKMDPRAHAGTGRRGATWRRLPFATLSTSVSGAAASAIEDEIAWITAGRPAADAELTPSFGNADFPVRTWGTLAVNRKQCRSSRAKVPLVRTGLRGGVAGPFDDRWACATPRRVLVRVRAMLTSRGTLRSYRSFLRTTVPLRSASLAVRTQAGKPLVYANVLENGRARLFTSPTCFPG